MPRVILASTGQVIDGHLLGPARPASTPDYAAAPRYLYACTKVFLESLGRVYAQQARDRGAGGAARVVPAGAGQEDEFRASALAQDVYLSPGDAGRFFAAAVGGGDWPRTADAEGRGLHRSASPTSPAGRVGGNEVYDLTARRAARVRSEPTTGTHWLAAHGR